ncbi:MAG: low molecular weight phosphotyrosine protein phosphatase [Deltaproteobacteria bacterium]|nr:low molecular weight phosphotyrosine protein phosphatase [Deltaproteobacteria bacterium]
MTHTIDWPRVRRVLLICTGNICRSPMAEGILRAKLEEHGAEDITVESAGTHGGAIAEPSPPAVDVCLESGIDISSHRSRLLTGEMLREADLVLFMDAGHENWIARKHADLSPKAWPITAFRSDRYRNAEVADPYGMPTSYYRRTYEMLDSSLEPIAHALATGRWDEEEIVED